MIKNILNGFVQGARAFKYAVFGTNLNLGEGRWNRAYEYLNLEYRKREGVKDMTHFFTGDILYLFNDGGKAELSVQGKTIHLSGKVPGRVRDDLSALLGVQIV